MRKRLRRRVAVASMVLASLGTASAAAVVISEAPAGATTGITCSDPLCVVYETIVITLGDILNGLSGV